MRHANLCADTGPFSLLAIFSSAAYLQSTDTTLTLQHLMLVMKQQTEHDLAMRHANPGALTGPSTLDANNVHPECTTQMQHAPWVSSYMVYRSHSRCHSAKPAEPATTFQALVWLSCSSLDSFCAPHTDFTFEVSLNSQRESLLKHCYKEKVAEVEYSVQLRAA